MTVAMPFLQKLITFLWPPDIGGAPFVRTGPHSSRHSGTAEANARKSGDLPCIAGEKLV